MKKTLAAALLAATVSAAPAANATEFDVTITNLSNAIYYTPFLVAAHRPAITCLSPVSRHRPTCRRWLRAAILPDL